MAVALAELEAMRDDLLRARASGVLEVRSSDGRRTVYRSDEELRAALASIEGRIARLSVQSTMSVVRITTSKGF